MTKKPEPKSLLGEKEFDRLEDHFKETEKNISNLTLDEMNKAPKKEYELEGRSQKEIVAAGDIYLKPFRSISSKEKFNERFREDYNYHKKYEPFEAINKEIKGDTIEMCTKPYPGCPAEFWRVPVGITVYGPKYLKEQLQRCNYHVIKMGENTGVIGSDGYGTYTGAVQIESTEQRVDAKEVNPRKSISFGGIKL